MYITPGFTPRPPRITSGTTSAARSTPARSVASERSSNHKGGSASRTISPSAHATSDASDNNPASTAGSHTSNRGTEGLSIRPTTCFGNLRMLQLLSGDTPMSRTLTLQIDDRLYEALSEAARRQGRSAEDIGAAWLAAVIERALGDPMMRLAGSLDSGTPDLAANHDAYLSGHVNSDLCGDEA